MGPERATGIYNTHAQLLAEVQRLVNIRPSLQQCDIAETTGVSPGTISTIVKAMRTGTDPIQNDLNQLLNKLWKVR
jgi:hypothetical protein